MTRLPVAAQVVTLIVWCSGRFFLYTSYFTIFGALFGATNFGRMVAIDNSINGIVGLLQFPFTAWALHGLHGNFTAINMIQAWPNSTGLIFIGLDSLIAQQRSIQCKT